MPFIPTHCPNCGRDIQVPDDVPRSKCMYCGVDIERIASRNAAVPTLGNYLGLARTALHAGNNAEAEQYFNRVLEIDPTVSEAWVGKGKAAAWQSSLAAIRLTETQVAFGHAIATASKAERATVIHSCVGEMNTLVVAIYELARTHMLEHVALDDTWPAYLVQVSQLLGGLDAALTWDATNQITLENIVHLCKDNIEGVAFRDPFNDDMPKAWHLSPEYEALVKARLDKATAQLRALDASYSPPVVQKQKADTCFVVTATMGSADHPYVFALRQFRDNELSSHAFGRRFVRWYCRHGPRLAAVIEHSSVLRLISLHCVVRPAAALAREVQHWRERASP